MPDLIPQEQLAGSLQKIPHWDNSGGGIERIFEFKNFAEALAFVNEVGGLAEEANHHPDIDIRWNKVRLLLVTHSAGGLTDLDVALAEQIDRLG